MEALDFIIGGAMLKGNQLNNKIKELEFMLKMETDEHKQNVIKEEMQRLIDEAKSFRKNSRRLLFWWFFGIPGIFLLLVILGFWILSIV